MLDHAPQCPAQHDTDAPEWPECPWCTPVITAGQDPAQQREDPSGGSMSHPRRRVRGQWDQHCGRRVGGA